MSKLRSKFRSRKYRRSKSRYVVGDGKQRGNRGDSPVQTSKRQCKRYQCVSRQPGKEFDVSLMRDGMRRKATSSCCRALLLCSNRDRATSSSDARPGLAPIQSLPPLVYSVYSRRRQQFSADARLARDAHREKFRGLLDFDIRRKKNETGSQIPYSGLVLVFDFSWEELGMLAECRWES